MKYMIVSILLVTGCTLVEIGGHGRSPHIPVNNAEYARTAVMITAENEQSGGTGVILDSHPGVSHILTNKHVCQLVQVGGKVITDNGSKYPVDSYQVYTKHDLCLIEVETDLGVNTKVADRAPKDYDNSIVVGHPSLLPTMITVGHFSQSRIISLVVGMSPCDGKENDDDALMCFLMGGKPITKIYEAQATSSLIMPGSSGSAVYNTKGELSGLIFAGSQGLSYGFLVPWAYVNDFLKHRNRYKIEIPDAKREPRNFFTSYFKLENICGAKSIITVPDVCNKTQNLGLWHQ
jgi:S1-C subfamily serine protease